LGSHRPSNPLPVDARELLDAQGLADWLGCSRSQVSQMQKEGSIPAPITFRLTPRWRRRELMAWIESGCPDPDRWKWEPAQVVKLSVLRDVLLREGVALREELNAAEAKLARGETMTMCRAG
jgi:predicted DNA-binding transcriptional regulator AlpA